MTTAIALVVVGASVLLGAIAALRTRNILAPLPLMLDLWIAAGLLRLTQSTSWTKIAAAAVLIAIRKLVGTALLGRVPRASRAR